MAQNYEFTGTVTEIFPTQSIGTNGFTKREFRVKEEKDSQWPNICGFILKKDKCSLADSLSVGAKVKVHFNLEGRIWEPEGKPSRCFVDLACWKLDILDKGKPKVPPPAEPTSDFDDGDVTDMPF